MKKIYLLVVLACFSFSACEKDDICDADTPTTPRLVISFFDINTPELAKNVTNLKVIGEGMSEGIIFSSSATGDAQYRTNANTVSIPLNPSTDTCTFSFILNDGNSNTAVINEDKLQFNYTRSQVFVSRACGFKTLFQLDTQNPVVKTDGSNGDGIWMQVHTIENANIEYENETHIKVFF